MAALGFAGTDMIRVEGWRARRCGRDALTNHAPLNMDVLPVRSG
jgi:hypothetical protein